MTSFYTPLSLHKIATSCSFRLLDFPHICPLFSLPTHKTSAWDLDACNKLLTGVFPLTLKHTGLLVLKSCFPFVESILRIFQSFLIAYKAQIPWSYFSDTVILYLSTFWPWLSLSPLCKLYSTKPRLTGPISSVC